MWDPISHLLEGREGNTREKDILDELRNYRAASDLLVKNAALSARCSGFQGALAVRRGRVPPSQVVQLAADVARRSGGAGRGVSSANCRVCLLHVWAVPSWHKFPSPRYWLVPPALPCGRVPSGPEKGVHTRSAELAPAVWTPASPSLPLEQWPNALFPMAFCHANSFRGSVLVRAGSTNC